MLKVILQLQLGKKNPQKGLLFLVSVQVICFPCESIFFLHHFHIKSAIQIERCSTNFSFLVETADMQG